MYQHILNRIVDALAKSRSVIWRQDLGRENFLEQANCYVQTQEYFICMSNDWNLNLGAGCETLGYILKMSNNEYDFRPIADKVNSYALNWIFGQEQKF